jgi:preprotein translocase subunit SecG
MKPFEWNRPHCGGRWQLSCISVGVSFRDYTSTNFEVAFRHTRDRFSLVNQTVSYPRTHKRENRWIWTCKERKMNPELPAFLVLLALSLAVPIILFLLLRVSLRDLLQQTVKFQSGVTFYLRSFFLVLFLSALSAAIGTSFDLKSGSRFMEYVWKGAEGLSSTLEKSLWFVAIYVVLITILVATLKTKDDK